ncbi:MAG: 1-(5-phosphoribosyl)-5-amino-4-imidazole-carboxylate carboxylase, partial [Symploca sp. SIO1B1]|nr:1-(5-phosphoribosyl)-5-amino-4-imidazole-carboxylate carboxylase [Symploca sp. SIO1B1]
MNQEILQNLLESVAAGQTAPHEALGKLKNFDFEAVG